MREKRFTPTDDMIRRRWSHIRMFLSVNNSDVYVEDDFQQWFFTHEPATSPCPKVAAAYDEWADYFEWRLAQRAVELADDRAKRHLVEEWTDTMAYCCRRSAVWARGDHPGEWVPQRLRRPDLEAEAHAIVNEIIAQLDTTPLREAS